MIRASFLLLAGLALLPAGVWAQDSTRVAAPSRLGVQAVRIDGRPPAVDGRLDEEVWQRAPAATGFVQRQPNEGAPATERTEVRFLFDEGALYVGARMRSSDPAAIQAPVSRRDQGSQAERLLVSLDTYLDRRTAYTFGITASGVRLDWYHPGDSETSTDASWDPVWEARAQIDSLGWTAEMRIPFSQLRFNRLAVQRWGLNVKRVTPSRNEEAYWVLVPQQETGWASRFGELAGIEGIRPTRRVELMPYVASGATFTSDPERGNPFAAGQSYTARVGGDVKMGLGPNLTLEGTVNPDFGQVELDPAEVNLSAFETFFPERRPFFREGGQLLRGNGPSYFYSRRIGAPPRAAVGADYVDYPRTSTILGAAKLTGRLASGTSVGALGALTDREYARTFDEESGTFGRVRVAPVTGYGVFRAQQELGPSGSTAGVSLTAVERDLASGDPLASLLNRRAYAGGGDWNLRFRDGEYVLGGYVGFSHVEGDSSAILHAQRSSLRYFQRADADHLTLDPSRTSLSGYNGSLVLSRVSGRHWLWDASIAASSPGRDINDAGAMGRTDWIFTGGGLRYRETRPGALFRNYEVGVSSENQHNFGGTRTFSALRTDSRVTWKNFWGTSFTGWIDLRSQSDVLTRGGPLMGTPQAWVTIAEVFNNPASRTRWRARVYYGESEQGEQTYRISGGYSIRPSPQWQLSVDPNYVRFGLPRQYIGQREGGAAETFGRRYIFSFIDRTELRLPLRLNYTFTPDLSLETYVEPFAASGRFYDFGELPAARSFDLRRYGTDGTTIAEVQDSATGRRFYRVADGSADFTLPFRDFNVRSFRSNAVLRWEWRPGSTLFLVWQQDRFAEEAQGRAVGLADLAGTLGAAGNNFLALKMTYWLPLR
ncbi:MAG: carbohydrate binding family 9 domain-containing protein [Gemmatimonadota bacterium]|nr:carbohydrate binding family 9 domain-containing protein [Gemmatimonadota bacterium]